MVKLCSVKFYYCVCDECKTHASVERCEGMYNGAQAVRSLGWSYGKDGKTLCQSCRQKNCFDKYK